MPIERSEYLRSHMFVPPNRLFNENKFPCTKFKHLVKGEKRGVCKCMRQLLAPSQLLPLAVGGRQGMQLDSLEEGGRRLAACSPLADPPHKGKT